MTTMKTVKLHRLHRFHFHCFIASRWQSPLKATTPFRGTKSDHCWRCSQTNTRPKVACGNVLFRCHICLLVRVCLSYAGSCLNFGLSFAHGCPDMGNFFACGDGRSSHSDYVKLLHTWPLRARFAILLLHNAQCHNKGLCGVSGPDSLLSFSGDHG